LNYYSSACNAAAMVKQKPDENSADQY